MAAHCVAWRAIVSNSH